MFYNLNGLHFICICKDVGLCIIREIPFKFLKGHWRFKNSKKFLYLLLLVMVKHYAPWTFKNLYHFIELEKKKKGKSWIVLPGKYWMLYLVNSNLNVVNIFRLGVWNVLEISEINLRGFWRGLRSNKPQIWMIWMLLEKPLYLVIMKLKVGLSYDIHY